MVAGGIPVSTRCDWGQYWPSMVAHGFNYTIEVLDVAEIGKTNLLICDEIVRT